MALLSRFAVLNTHRPAGKQAKRSKLAKEARDRIPLNLWRKV